MANGAHIILDCTGIVGVEGSWMLSLMEQAVDLSGARRVHSHIENFDGSVSPIGFAAVVLLDYLIAIVLALTWSLSSSRQV